MCSTPQQRIAAFGRAIDDLASQARSESTLAAGPAIRDAAEPGPGGRVASAGGAGRSASGGGSASAARGDGAAEAAEGADVTHRGAVADVTRSVDGTSAADGPAAHYESGANDGNAADAAAAAASDAPAATASDAPAATASDAPAATASDVADAPAATASDASASDVADVADEARTTSGDGARHADDAAAPVDVLSRLAELWAELAALDPEVAKRLPTYEA